MSQVDRVSMEPSLEFLTPEECAQVDRALLTSSDKFAARVAIYALRSLKQIAQATGSAIEQLTPDQIEDWVYQDPNLQAGLDSAFKPFFFRLVSSSLTPLNQAAQMNEATIADLTLLQVIQWFETEAKQKLR